MSSALEAPRVAILVPWYRESLTADEELSLDRLLHHLGGLDIRIVKPAGLDGSLAGRPVEEFPDTCFESRDAYSRLLLSVDFYRRFSHYEFVLIHQLDALLLSPDLEPWLDMPWDYIGAPWLVDAERPQLGFSHVGNGGLSLRRVDACLRVLDSRSRPKLPALLTARLPDQRHRPAWQRWTKRLRVLREARRGVGWYAGHYSLNEDRFWSERAALFDRDFLVAPVRAGLGFAFEAEPRLAFESTGGRLPLGAHAWAKRDRAFWEPRLAGGSTVAEATS